MWLTEEQLCEMDRRAEIDYAVEEAVKEAVKETEQRAEVAEQKIYEAKVVMTTMVESVLANRFLIEYPSFADELKARLLTKSPNELSSLMKVALVCNSLSDFARSL